MKKLLFGLSAVVITGIYTFVCAWDTPKFPTEFINSIEKCTPYNLPIGPVDVLGMKVTTEKQVVSKQNGYCTFIETVRYDNEKSVIKCRFSQAQIDKLVKAMRNPVNTNQPLSVKTDSSGRREISGGDEASRLWTEYYNNPSICTHD